MKLEDETIVGAIVILYIAFMIALIYCFLNF